MTDHRAVAADLMAETAACPDASEHLLAAIHDLLAERLPMPGTAVSTPSSAGVNWPKAKGGFVPQPSYDAEGFVCEGCGRHLPCRHCPDGPKTAQNAAQEALGGDSGTQGHWGGSGAHSGDSGPEPDTHDQIGSRCMRPNCMELHDPEPESVTVTLPERILGRPWTVAELRMLAEWADNAGSGEAGTVLGHVADALDAASATQEAAEGEGTDGERLVMACDWSDFRKDYGVSSDATVSTREHRAFKAGWKAGRHGDQSGVLR